MAGTNGTLCGLDLGLKLLRGGGEIGRLRSNWTLLACRGLGPDVARPGRTKVYGGFGLTKSNFSSASLSCTEVRDEAGRCEVRDPNTLRFVAELVGMGAAGRVRMSERERDGWMDGGMEREGVKEGRREGLRSVDLSTTPFAFSYTFILIFDLCDLSLPVARSHAKQRF